MGSACENILVCGSTHTHTHTDTAISCDVKPRAQRNPREKADRLSWVTSLYFKHALYAHRTHGTYSHESHDSRLLWAPDTPHTRRLVAFLTAHPLTPSPRNKTTHSYFLSFIPFVFLVHSLFLSACFTLFSFSILGVRPEESSGSLGHSSPVTLISPYPPFSAQFKGGPLSFSLLRH